jgi:hypothetical protein
MNTNTEIKTAAQRMEGGSFNGMGAFVYGSDTVKTAVTGEKAQIAARDSEITDLRAEIARLQADRDAKQVQGNLNQRQAVFKAYSECLTSTDLLPNEIADKLIAAALAQRVGSGLEAPMVREFQWLDRGKLYDICCRQSHAIKESEKCIKRYQDELAKTVAASLVSATTPPAAVTDAELVKAIRTAMQAAKTGHGSHGPNYDGNKLAAELKAAIAASEQANKRGDTTK